MPTSRELLYRTRDWHGPSPAGGVQLAEPPLRTLPLTADVDAFAVEWQVAAGGEPVR